MFAVAIYKKKPCAIICIGLYFAYIGWWVGDGQLYHFFSYLGPRNQILIISSINALFLVSVALLSTSLCVFAVIRLPLK